MSGSEKLYCKIFMDTDISKDELLQLVSEITHGERKVIRTILAKHCEVDVNINEDYNPTKKSRGQDQFLFYRYFLDVVPTPSASRQSYVQCTGALLKSLLTKGYTAVAACSFEDELPPHDQTTLPVGRRSRKEPGSRHEK